MSEFVTSIKSVKLVKLYIYIYIEREREREISTTHGCNPVHHQLRRARPEAGGLFVNKVGEIMYKFIIMCIYIYIYIWRERERERGRKR